MQNPWLTPAAAADSPNNTPWISRRNLEELQTVVGFLNIVNLNIHNVDDTTYT